MTDLDLPVDVKPLSLPGVFTAQYEIDTLPLLFSSDAVFNQYYEALVRKNSHVAARLEDLRNRNSLARQHRMAGLWQECVDTLWQCVEARRELFDATDFQITAAQRHFVMTLLNFATYFLREGGNGRTSAEEAMLFRSFGLFKRAEEAVTVIDDRSDRMLLKAMVDNNYAAYYMRRRKQKAAYQRMGSAIKAYNAYLKLTTGKGLEGAGGGLRGTGTGSRSVGGEGGIISRRTSSAAVQQANAAMSSGFGGHSSSDSDSDAEGGDHTKKNKNKSSDLPANMSDAEFKSRTEALYFAFQSGTGDIFAGNFEDSLKKLLAAVKNAEILQKAVDAPLASSSSGEVSPSPKKSSGGEANNESPIARSKLITDKEKNNTNDTISSNGGESGATTAKDSPPLASSQIAIEQSPTKKSSRASSRASDRSSSRHSSVSSRASSRVTASSHHKSRSSSSVSSRASASAAHSPNKEGGEASENVYSSDAYSSSDDDGGSPKTRGRGKKSQSPKREKVKPEDKAEKKEVSTPQHDDSLAERKKEEDDEPPLSASSSPRSGAETTPTKQRRSSTSPRAAAAAPTDGGFAIQIIGSAAPTDVLAVIALYHNIAVAYVGLRKHRDAAKWAQRALDVSAANGDSGVRSDSTFVKIIVRCKEFCDKMSFRQRRLQDARGAAAANDTTIVGKQVRGLLMMRAASVGSARQRASSNTSSRRGTSADINRRQNAEEDRKSAIVAREAFNHPKSAEAAKAYLPRHTAPSPSASGRTPRYAEPTAVEKLQTYLKGLSYRQLVEDYGIDDGGRYYKMQQQQKKRHTKEDKEKSRLQREQSQREKEEAKKAEKERVKKRQEATEQRRADLISAQQSRVVTPRGPAAAPTSTSTAAHSAVGSRATTPRGGGNKGASSPPAAVPSATTASTRGAIPPPPPPPPPPASHHNEDNAAKNDAHEKKESNEEDDNNNNTLPREEKNEHHLDGIEAKAQHLEEGSAKEQEKDDEKVNDDSNLNNESNTDQKAEDAIQKTATDTKKAHDGDKNEKVSQKEEKEASEGAEEDDNISNSEDEADAAARQKAEEARLSAQAKAITEMAPSSNSKANEEVNVSAQKDRDEEEKAVIANAATPPASDTPRVAEKENTSSTPPPPPPPLPLNAQTLSAAAASANRTEKKRTEEKGYSDGEEDFEKDSSVFSSLPNSARKGAPTSAEADVDETKPAEIVVALADANQQKQQIARSGTPPLEPAPPTEISAVVSSSIEIKDKSEHAPPAAKDNNHDNTFGYDDDDFAPESPMKRTADGEARDQKHAVEEEKEKTDSIKSDLSSRSASTPPSDHSVSATPPSPTTPLQQPAATSDSKTEQEEKEAEKVAGGVDDDEAAGYGSDEFEDESPRKENKAARAVALSDDVADDKEKLETKLASAAEEDVAPKSSAVADNEEQKEVDYSEEDEDDAYGDEDFESSPANSPSKNLIGAAIPNDADEEQREEEDAKAFDEAEQSVPAAEEREEPYADDDFEEEL